MMHMKERIWWIIEGFESYVQEVGRAGRDGLAAECHVFLEPEVCVVSLIYSMVLIFMNNC